MCKNILILQDITSQNIFQKHQRAYKDICTNSHLNITELRIVNATQVAKSATWNFHFLRFLFSLLFLTRSNALSACSYSICIHMCCVEHIYDLPFIMSYRLKRVDMSRKQTRVEKTNLNQRTACHMHDFVQYQNVNAC